MPAEVSVLLLCPQSTGGIGRHVRMLAEALVTRGARVTVAAPAETLARFELAGTGAQTLALAVGTARSALGDRRRLRQLSREHDVTHAHSVRAAAAAALAGGSPLVATWHNAPLGSPLRRGLHATLERYSARRAAVVLGASADLVERARAAGARRTALCTVAAPPSGSEPATAAARLLHEPPVVLAIGRLHPQKRLDLLVEVAAAWPPGPGRPEFRIAGDGPLAGKLRRQAAERRAPVQFLGARADVADLLAAADVVALPSDWEARPLAAQEALRAGVPLVATDVGGVRDLVGEAAVLVPAGDAAALGAGLRLVLEDAATRDRLRVAGPAQAAGWPTVEQMVDQIWSTYLDLISTPRQPPR